MNPCHGLLRLRAVEAKAWRPLTPHFQAALAHIDQRVRARTKKTRRGPTRFPGITADAERLGVNRTTLFRALVGDWRLPGLLGRYHVMKSKTGGAR